jgi:MFS transporter, FHS family, glucose/mannose:H+ symporter
MNNRRVLLTISFLGMLSFGIVLTTLGAALPDVITRFGIDKAQAGALLGMLTIGILAGSLLFGPIVDRRGYKGVLLVALLAIVAGLEIIAFAPSLGVMRLGITLIGFGGGIVNGATSALVADVSAEARSAALSVLGVFFGIGAAGVPLAMSLLTKTYSQTAILAAVGTFAVVPLVLTIVTTFPAAKQRQGFPLAHVGGLLRDRVLLLFGLILFVQSGMELTVGGWTSTYFGEELRVPPDRALAYLSLYWLGMMLSRLALGFVLRRTPPVRAMLTCIAIAIIGALSLIFSGSVTVAATGVFLVGAGFGGNFPIVLGFVGDRYAELSGTAFSLVIVMALIGGTALPYIAGVLGDTYGLRTSFFIVPVSLILSATLLLICSRNVGSPIPEPSSTRLNPRS